MADQVAGQNLAQITGAPTQIDPEAANQYDAAVSKRDPIALMEVAKRNFGTPVADASIKAADLLYKTSKEFNSYVSPIEKLGGIATREGKLAAVKTWQTVKDDPQYGTAIIMHLLGDKEGASRMITGGAPEVRISFTKTDGIPIRETVNKLGQIISAYDTKNQRYLSQQEYDALGAKTSALENTLSAIEDKKNLEINVAAFAKDTENTNAWTAKLRALAPDTQRLLALGTELQKYDLPNDLRDQLFQANSRSFQQMNNASASKQILAQMSKSGGFTDGQEFNEEFGSMLGLGKEPVKWNAQSKSFVGVKSGRSVSASDMEQRLGSTNIGNEVRNNFEQTQKTLAEYLKIKGLDATVAAKVRNYMATSENIAVEMAKLAAKHDMPDFMAMPATASIVDSYKQGVVQALGVLMNADAAEKYQKFHNETASLYGPGTAPKPKQFFQEFSKTQAYQDITNGYSKLVMDLLNAPSAARAQTEKKQEPKKPPETAAKAPPKSKRPLNELIPLR